MLRGVLRVAVLFVLSTCPAFGRGPVGEVNGNAADQTGAALPGAATTITEETTGLIGTAVDSVLSSQRKGGRP